MDFEADLVTLEMGETKNDDPRCVPILKGDMRNLLIAAKQERDAKWPHSPFVFGRQGERLKDFRDAWDKACIRANLPGFKFHDLRRTAVRNMRRAGIPQVIRMKISGHKTDSMERRYNIVDGEDLSIAKALMEQRQKAAKTVTKNVTAGGNPTKLEDSDD